MTGTRQANQWRRQIATCSKDEKFIVSNRDAPGENTTRNTTPVFIIIRSNTGSTGIFKREMKVDWRARVSMSGFTDLMEDFTINSLNELNLSIFIPAVFFTGLPKKLDDCEWCSKKEWITACL